MTRPAAAAAILAVFIVSPVFGWTWTGEGVLDGFFGWANLLRNIATVVLSLGIYWLVRRPQRSVAVLVGVVGIFALPLQLTPQLRQGQLQFLLFTR